MSDIHSEVKKAIYRQNPEALLTDPEPRSRPGKTYKCKLEDGTEVLFFVPEAEITVRFDNAMPAKFLIRWMIKYTPPTSDNQTL